MKKYLLIAFLFLQIILIKQSGSQILFIENFDYPAGDSIGAHGWTWNTGTTNTIMVVSPGLTFASYPLSGIGNSCRLKNNGNDAYKPLTSSDSTGSNYTSFMVNIDSSQALGGDYFFALLPSASTTNYTARLYVKDTTAGMIFGITKGTIASNPVTWTSGTYSKNTTYLFVVKYTFNTGSTTDDEIRVYIFNSAIPGTEPGTATIGPVTGPATDAGNIGRVAIRQGSSTIAPTLNIDGIMVSKSWGNISAVQNISVEIPSSYSLKQNYPNPFNPSTKIEFQLVNSSQVNLEVYDALGRKVANLVNERLNSGTFSYNFNATGLTSGVYFYKLSATEIVTGRNFVDTKSMILIK
jgi:hypothetical protein